jgi:hypothetical protein
MKSQGNPGKQGFPEWQASLHAECPEKPNGVVLGKGLHPLKSPWASGPRYHRG